MSDADAVTLAGGALWSCLLCVVRHREQGRKPPRSFGSERALQQHIEHKHTHICVECDKVFATGGSLAQHCSAKHPEAP